MKKMYAEFACYAPNGETDKAVAFDYDHGHYGTGHLSHKWFPKSQLIIGEENEVGLRSVLIPKWLLDKNDIDPHRLYDLRFQGYVTC